MNRDVPKTSFTIIAILFVILFTGIIFTSNRIFRLEQREKANRVKLECLRTRVYILEGEMNMAKARARRFWCAVDRIKEGRQSGLKRSY